MPHYRLAYATTSQAWELPDLAAAIERARELQQGIAAGWDVRVEEHEGLGLWREVARLEAIPGPPDPLTGQGPGERPRLRQRLELEGPGTEERPAG
jgi:hypothetical protein